MKNFMQNITQKKLICSGLIVIAIISMGVKSLANPSGLAAHLKELKTSFELKDGKFFLVDGVNCHSTSLNSSGYLNYPTYVDAKEFNYVLDSYCRKVPRPTNGTIAAQQRRSYWGHSYYHIKPDLVFEKKGMLRKDPYEVKKRGYYNNVEYFQCEFQNHECPALRKMANRVRLIGLYYANLSTGFGEYKYLDVFSRYLKKQEQDLKAMKVSSASCVKKKNDLLNRLDSLAVWDNNLSNGGYLMQRLPQGPKL